MTTGQVAAARAYRNARYPKGGPCRTRGCRGVIAGFDGCCNACRLRKRRYGQVDGAAIRFAETAPPRKAALAYLSVPGVAGHERIAAGLRWCSQWLLSGEPQGDNWESMSPAQTIKHFLWRLEGDGVSDADVLAAIVALSFVRRYRPGIIKGDRHWQFSVVRAILHTRPWPTIGYRALAGGGGLRRVAFDNPRPNVIAAAWAAIPAGVLVLADDIAAVLRDHEERLWLSPEIYSSAPLPGAFYNSNQTTKD